MLNHTLLISTETVRQPMKTSSHLLSFLFETFTAHTLLAFFNPFPAAKEGWGVFCKYYLFLLSGIPKFK